MGSERFIDLLKEGKKLSQIGKLQFANNLIQESMFDEIFTKEEQELLVRIQFNIFVICNVNRDKITSNDNKA